MAKDKKNHFDSLTAYEKEFIRDWSDVSMKNILLSFPLTHLTKTLTKPFVKTYVSKAILPLQEKYETMVNADDLEIINNFFVTIIMEMSEQHQSLDQGSLYVPSFDYNTDFNINEVYMAFCWHPFGFYLNFKDIIRLMSFVEDLCIFKGVAIDWLTLKSDASLTVEDHKAYWNYFHSMCFQSYQKIYHHRVPNDTNELLKNHKMLSAMFKQYQRQLCIFLKNQRQPLL